MPATVVVGTIEAHRQPAQAALVRAIAGSGTPTIAVAMRTPWDAMVYPAGFPAIATYSILPEPLEALELKNIPVEPLQAFLEDQGFKSLLTRLAGGSATASAGRSSSGAGYNDAMASLEPKKAPPPQDIAVDRSAYETVTDAETLASWIAEARAAGYRSCRRCKPDEVGRDREAIAKAVKLIEAAEEAPSLSEISAAVGYAPHHFQRIFTRDLGVSPAGYWRGLRAKRAADALAKLDLDYKFVGRGLPKNYAVVARKPG